MRSSNNASPNSLSPPPPPCASLLLLMPDGADVDFPSRLRSSPELDSYKTNAVKSVVKSAAVAAISLEATTPAGRQFAARTRRKEAAFTFILFYSVPPSALKPPRRPSIRRQTSPQRGCHTLRIKKKKGYHTLSIKSCGSICTFVLVKQVN